MVMCGKRQVRNVGMSLISDWVGKSRDNDLYCTVFEVLTAVTIHITLSSSFLNRVVIV
jgi:hypothetical protein